MLLPHQDRDVRIRGDLVVGRSVLLSDHRQRDVLDAGLLGQLLESFVRLVAVFGHDDDEALETSIFANLLIDLLDQTGQGLGGLAGENADHRSSAISSAVAESRALVRAGDILDVERGDGFTGLQARLDGISREAGPHDDDGDHHGRDALSRIVIALASPLDGPERTTERRRTCRDPCGTSSGLTPT